MEKGMIEISSQLENLAESEDKTIDEKLLKHLDEQFRVCLAENMDERNASALILSLGGQSIKGAKERVVDAEAFVQIKHDIFGCDHAGPCSCPVRAYVQRNTEQGAA